MSNEKERVNYVIENGSYCGHTVNFPIIIQAESLDDLKQKVLSMSQYYLKEVQRVVENNDFEYVEQKGWESHITFHQSELTRITLLFETFFKSQYPVTSRDEHWFVYCQENGIKMK